MRACSIMVGFFGIGGFTSVSEFVGGQRWISETEPELGLGMVLSCDTRRVTLLFHGSGAMRQYARAGAPLKRVRFQPGDTVHSHEGWAFTVEVVEEQGGLLTYRGAGRELHETALSNYISFSKPQDRLFAGQIDPSRQFELRIEALERQAAARRSPLRGLLGARIELLPHQLYIAHEVAERHAPRVLLADEVGLGKTIEAGLILHRLIVGGRAARALVVVPEPLLHQWTVEMLRRFNLAFSLYDEERCAQAGSANPFLAEQLVLLGLDFLVAHPERAEQAAAAGWDLLIVDEAHHLGWTPHGASPEYTLVERLAARTPGLLLLTATPEQLGEAGHFARLRLLDPQRFHDLDAFLAETGHYRAIAAVVEALLAARALESAERAELLGWLAGDAAELAALDGADADAARERIVAELLDRHGTGRVLFRNTRAAMPSFPSRVLCPLPLPCPEAYGGLEASLTPERAWRGETPWWRVDPRVDALAECLAAGDKVLVICARRETVLELDEALRIRSGVPVALFHEDMALLARDRAAAWFADRDGARALICSEIGSEGRNFQFAQHLFLFDLPLEPELLEQRIGRLDRIGQRADIRIHVPYLRGTAQETLYRWYVEGLNAFAAHARAAQAVFERIAPRLRAALEGCEDVASLLAATVALNAALGDALERGRDRLLELHSFREAPARVLAADIAAADADPTLERFMERLLDHFGVDQEEHSEHAVVLKPGEHMFTSAFPGLPDAGLTVTYSRARALGREDMGFLSWDHPMVDGALELLLGTEHGNAACSAWRLYTADLPELLVEAVFVLECVAPGALGADRFLPPTPLRVLIDPQLHELGAQFGSAALGVIDLPTPEAREVLTANQRLLKRMLTSAEHTAADRADAKVKDALARMQAELTPEVERLRRLAAVNPSVRAEEIEFAETRIAELYRHLSAARVRFDALRVVVRRG